MPAHRAKAIVPSHSPSLGARVKDLDARVTRLERRLSVALPLVRKDQSAGSSGRPRPRCPGCTLEIPKGRRREECVWCGFRFDALQLLRRSATAPRRRRKRV